MRGPRVNNRLVPHPPRLHPSRLQPRRRPQHSSLPVSSSVGRNLLFCPSNLLPPEIGSLLLFLSWTTLPRSCWHARVVINRNRIPIVEGALVHTIFPACPSTVTPNRKELFPSAQTPHPMFHTKYALIVLVYPKSTVLRSLPSLPLSLPRNSKVIIQPLPGLRHRHKRSSPLARSPPASVHRTISGLPPRTVTVSLVVSCI